MQELFYRPQGAWVGDLIPYYENGTYYAYYLHDPRVRPGEYAEETTWHLATTRDMVRFDYKGEAIARGGDDKPHKNIYTGSVLRGRDGQCYAFYTAYNADLKVNGKSVQSVMRAVGPDPEHLVTDESFLLQADGEIYESFDWRDPYVFWDEERCCYWMLLAARRNGAGAHRGGCVGLCRSEDLTHWTLEQPFYAPQMYITMECPEVFRMGEWWYLVFSTFSDRFVTHYRKSKSLFGQWMIPRDDVFDNRANYAIKTASDGVERYAMGWIPSKVGELDDGPWEWGGTMVIHQVRQDSNGDLWTGPTKGMLDAFQEARTPRSWTVYNGTRVPSGDGCTLSSDTLGAALFPLPEDRFQLECELRPEEGCGEFGLALHTDPGMENGYFLRFDAISGTVAWDLWPRAEQGMYQWQIAGDIPYQVETQRRFRSAERYHIRLIREKDICVVYVNDEAALSARLYQRFGELGGIYLIQGSIQIDSCRIWI